jgi:hypothetical protein
MTNSGDLFDSIKGLVDEMKSSLERAISPIEISKTIEEVDNGAVRIAKSFGQGRENVLGLSQAMAGAVREVTLLGGGFQDIVDIQDKIGIALGRNLVLSTDSYEKLYAAQSVTGQQAETIVSAFKDVGISVYQSTNQMQQVVDISRSMGVSAQAVSKEVVGNIEALNKYNFQDGVQGLARMAAQATSLRIDMRETLRFAEKVFNPEGAIEAAAAMQRLGIANSELLDPLRLMDLSQNDPAELQNQLTKMTTQFVQLNEKGQFEIMPGAKRQLREISSALDIPFETLTKMAIGTKELDEKLQRINFAGFSFTEEQKTLIAQMSEMGADGQFKIMVEGKGEMDLDKALAEFQSDPKLLEALEKSAQPKTMEELAKEQLTVSQSMAANIESMTTQIRFAVSGTRAAKDALTAPERITREVSSVTMGTESMSIRNLMRGLDEGSTRILEDINKLIKGDGSLGDLITTMSDLGTQFEKFGTNVIDESTVKYGESIQKLEDANNQFINILLNSKDKIKEIFMLDQNLTPSQPQTPQPISPPTPSLPNPIASANMVGQTTTTPTNNSPIDINLNITTPPGSNIDTNQLVIAFRDTGVREAMVNAINTARTNDNLTATNPNPQRQMVITNNSNGLTGIPVA